MQFIINLVVFLLSLGMLVIIHELGHFITAKIFKVYCREFSIGMGPLLLKYKGKNWETQLSLRAIPLGGFVSMVGEDAGDSELIGGQKDVDENKEELSEEEKYIASLPNERKLNGIAKWKRAIIMAAGVFNNIILALLLFLISNANMHILDENKRSFANVIENSIVYNAKITTEDEFKSANVEFKLTFKDTKGTENKDDDELIIYDQTKVEGLDNYQIKNGDDLYRLMRFEFIKPGNNVITAFTETDFIKYTLTTDKEEIKEFTIHTKKNNDIYQLETYGIMFQTRKYTFKEVFSNTFNDMGESSIAIYKALGQLFTKEGISQVGGPIAVFQVSAQFSTLGIEYYCRLWGLISINLAIMNFLPFPGLDGWHFVVLIFEGITKKEMPSKVKNTLSTIGILLLFGLMILISFKDIFSLFIVTHF